MSSQWCAHGSGAGEGQDVDCAEQEYAAGSVASREHYNHVEFMNVGPSHAAHAGKADAM